MHTGRAAPQSGAGRLAPAADWKPIAYPPSMDEETFVTQYGFLLACLSNDGGRMTLISPVNDRRWTEFEKRADGTIQFVRYDREYGDPHSPNEAARKLFAFFLGHAIDESAERS